MILVVLLVLGGAFAWAFTRPDKKASRANTAPTTTVSALTPATLPPPKPYKVTDGVNVRGAPTTNSAIVMMVETGKPVTVVCRTEGQSVTAASGSSNQWLRVTVGESAGYVSALYVETHGDIEDKAVIGICGPA